MGTGQVSEVREKGRERELRIRDSGFGIQGRESAVQASADSTLDPGLRRDDRCAHGVIRHSKFSIQVFPLNAES
jgi:hypothetical protein